MDILHDFGGGLVLRRATRRDTDALVNLQIHVFANPDTGELDEYVGGWTRDLMRGKHPTFRPEDFLLVEDTKTHLPVSCMCLISQTWRIENIPFGVGRVEIVATDPAYRRRGLIREQFRVVHELSQARGEMVQAITGIPYYYRQFGYEYALELVAPRQTFVPQQVPERKKGEREKFRLRRAKREDWEFVAAMYEQACKRTFVSCDRDVRMFEYEHFKENDSKSTHARWWDAIETRKGERVGILLHRRFVHQGRHASFCFEILPQFAWGEVTPFILRELVRQGEKIKNVDKKPLTALAWFLISNHPLYQAAGDRTAPFFGGYEWYLRVPDLPSFLLKLAPVMERRIATSAFRNYTGTLRLNFFRSGLDLIFENGTLATVAPWQATAGDYGQSGLGNATFPDLTFLKLLFGNRTRAELQAMFADCLMDNEQTGALLDILFPKVTTEIIPIH